MRTKTKLFFYKMYNMEEPIYKCSSEEFPFDDISLANPTGLQGGAYVSKLKILGKNIILQTPTCATKNGIIKTDKKIYCDLMFDIENDDVRNFFDKLSDKIKNLVFEKKDIWFHTDMDMDTIDYHWQNVLRQYKGTKYLLRCSIKKPHRSKVSIDPSIQIYDEDESLLSIDDVVKDKQLMGLLHLGGLKFTSQSFSLEFFLEQAMLIKKREINKRCRIQFNSPQINKKDQEHIDENSEMLSTPENEDIKESTIIPDLIDSDVTNITTEEEIPEEDDVNIKKEEPVVPKALDLQSPIVTLNTNSKTMITDSSEQTTLKSTDITPPIANNNTPSSDQANIIVDDLAESGGDSLEKTNTLDEVILTVPEDFDAMTLKKPNEVYMEIYKEARRRAKAARKKAIEAYLEVKRIKSTYMLDEIEVEDSDEDDDILENTNEEIELAR